MAWVKKHRNEHNKRERAGDLKRKDNKGRVKRENKGRKGSDKFDDVCAICDDGGRVVCCEGGCLRSFHPTKKHAGKSMCRTLKLTEEQWKLIKPKEVKYKCENCKYKQHQCFACGLLGSSDLSSGAEVFQCKDKKCGHFYHPKCVSRLLNIQAVEFAQRFSGGLEFLCPIHKCVVCKGTENKDDKEMQFAVCRRCPTAYHRKCLPSDISFKGNPQRAWRKILPGQILIYCSKHEIVSKLGTPKRNHIVFPDPERPKGALEEHDALDEDELLDHSSSHTSSEPPAPAETENEPRFSSNHRDSFAPRSLFPRPQPGSCGWLDD